MRINSKTILYVLVISFVVTCSVYGSKIELDFTEVELVSRAEHSMIHPTPDPPKVVEGPFHVYLKGVGNKKELEIRFEVDEPEICALMIDHLEFQYCIVSNDGECQWSEWMYLNQLPLKILLRDQGLPSPIHPNMISDSPAQLQLLLKFRVPQSINIQPGVYLGECSLKIY